MNSEPTRIPPEKQMMQMLMGAWISNSICVAARLGVADELRHGPKTVDELAEACDANPSPLLRLLRAMTSLGIFREDAQGRFEQTKMSEMLVDDAPNSLRSAALMISTDHYEAWGALFDAVKTGRSAFEIKFKQGVFEYYEANEEAGRNFHRAMTEITRRTHVAALDAYDFGQFKKLIDVGGGRGTLIAAILEKHPNLTGVLFDQPSLWDEARRFLDNRGVGERCEFSGGDFFKSVPQGGDAYVLSTVIHDWDDEASERILTNVRRAMSPQAKVLLIEQVLKQPNVEDPARFADLNMLVMTTGRERSEAEFAELFARSGLRLKKVYPTKSSSNVIEAVRA